MALARPTLSTLINRALTDANAAVVGVDTFLRRAVLRVLPMVQAALAHNLWGYVARVAQNLMYDTADAEHLVRHATIFDVLQKERTVATGQFQVTGVNGTGITIGTVVQRQDGVECVTTAAPVWVGTTATLAISAAVAGAAGNADMGTTLTFPTPILNVATQGVVTGTDGLSGGVDDEDPEDLRTRLLARIRNPPQGGCQTDYEAWAKEVSGVTRAWVYPSWNGPGTVGVTFVMDGRVSIIPLAGDVTAVSAHIAAVRPVTAGVTVFAPTTKALNLTIHAVPATADVKAAIAASIADLLTREAEPGGTILLSHIQEAIAEAAGETDHTLTVPSANVTSVPGELIVLGAITWT